MRHADCSPSPTPAPGSRQCILHLVLHEFKSDKVHKLMENQPTIDAAAADHVVLEQGEEEGEEEEMRALELIVGEKSGRIPSE